jgi:hypothetical protein
MDTTAAELGSLIRLNVFTTGRRAFALRQVKLIAQKQGFAELEAHCDAALKHEELTRGIELRWTGQPVTPNNNPAVRHIDALVDRTLGAIRDQAVTQTIGAPPDDPIHQNVELFLRRVFPLGVHAVSTLPYIDELEAADQIAKLLRGELSALVRELGLAQLTERLADLVAQYREALEATPESVMDWGKVRAVQAEGQGMLLEAVCIILGKHRGRTPQGTASRAVLLGPILKQNEAISQYVRLRRPVVDVDPETGLEEPSIPSGAGDKV